LDAHERSHLPAASRSRGPLDRGLWLKSRGHVERRRHVWGELLWFGLRLGFELWLWFELWFELWFGLWLGL
jgi:hypothetical protein